MAETCDEVMLVIHCDLPPGHSEDEHHADIPLPADVNRLIDAALSNLEREAARYRKMRRFSLLTFGLWACCAATYIWLIIVGIA